MKKRFLALVFLASTLMISMNLSQISAAVIENDIQPDHHFYWDKDHEWDPEKGRGNYRFYTLNGDIYSIRGKYSDGLDLFKFDPESGESGKFEYIHQIYDPSGFYYCNPLHDPIMFQFAGEYYAFYYYESFYNDGNYIENLGRRFLQTHAKKIGKDSPNDWKVHSVTHEGEGDKHDFKIYRDVVSIGDHLYFIYDSIIEDSINKYWRRYICIDKAVIDTAHNLKVLKTWFLEKAMGREAHHPAAATWFTHPDGKPRILISYSAENTSGKENKGGGVVIFSPEDENPDDSWQHLFRDKDDDYVFSVRAMHGTMQGKRDQSNVAGDSEDRKNSNRIQVIYNHFRDAYWDGLTFHRDKGIFRYITYKIEYDGNSTDYTGIEKGEIKGLGDKDYYPDEWDRMNLDLAYELIPYEQSDSDAAYSLHQKLWMFHNDKDGYIRGCGFNSDIWHHFAKVISDDLWNDNPEDAENPGYGERIKDTWVLFGIIEGAPPLAVDWEEWDLHYDDPPMDPTELCYTQETGTSYKATLKSSASWFIAAEYGSEEEGGFGVSTKFSQKLEYETETTTKTHKEQSLHLVLNDETQQEGKKLYIIPSITRIAYATYSWWEKDNVFSEENRSSQPISYRFLSSAQKIHMESVPLDDELFGFDISNLNTPEMNEWKAAFSPERNRLLDAYNQNKDYTEALSIEWNGKDGGGSASFEIATEKSLTTTHENEFEIATSFSVPEVFKIEGGGSFTWSNSSTVTTSTSESIEVSYANITKSAYGIKVGGLEMTAYWFYNNFDNLWYVDLIEEEGQKPWYIGYTVEKVIPKEDLENPIYPPDPKPKTWRDMLINEIKQ